MKENSKLGSVKEFDNLENYPLENFSVWQKILGT